MNKKAKKVINVFIDILVVLVMVVSVFTLVLSITSDRSGIPNLFGYAPLSVQSDSMSPTFEEGDLIISKLPEDASTAKYEVGDVVTYTIRIMNDDGIPVDVFNTHRVVEIVEDESLTYLRTQGDNRKTNSD